MPTTPPWFMGLRSTLGREFLILFKPFHPYENVFLICILVNSSIFLYACSIVCEEYAFPFIARGTCIYSANMASRAKRSTCTRGIQAWNFLHGTVVQLVNKVGQFFGHMLPLRPPVLCAPVCLSVCPCVCLSVCPCKLCVSVCSCVPVVHAPTESLCLMKRASSLYNKPAYDSRAGLLVKTRDITSCIAIVIF